jgi:hypothetical protein
MGHGMPAPPQLQAREPENGRSGWLSQIQRLLSQRAPHHRSSRKPLKKGWRTFPSADLAQYSISASNSGST